LSPNREKHRKKYAEIGRQCAVAAQSLDTWRPKRSGNYTVMQLVTRHGMSGLERRSLEVVTVGKGEEG